MQSKTAARRPIPAAVAFCQILCYPRTNPLRARGADNKGPTRLSPRGERRSKEAVAVFAVRRKRSQADFAPPTGRFVTSLRGEVMPMVTYEGLFAYSMVLLGVVTLVFQICKKK